MRNYLKTRKLSRDQANLVFRFRTRMVSEVKNNFRSSFENNLSCPVCPSGEVDSQKHLITCRSLNNETVTSQEYNALFGNDEDKIATVIKKLEVILKQRREIMEQ